MRLTGSIPRRDLALIFARAADLGAENPSTAKLGQRLLEQMIARSCELVRDEAPPPTGWKPAPKQTGEAARHPTAQGFDLEDLTRSIEDVLAKSASGEGGTTEPLLPTVNRREAGKLGLETLEELFVRGGQVRFEGHLEELEQTLEELFERFRSASHQFGITVQDLERGNLLPDSPELLESRRATRKAARGGADMPGSLPTPPPPGSRPGSGRFPQQSPFPALDPPHQQPRRPTPVRPYPALTPFDAQPPRGTTPVRPASREAVGRPPSREAGRPPSSEGPREPFAPTREPFRDPFANAVDPFASTRGPPPHPIASAPPVLGTASVIGELWQDEPGGGVRVGFARPGVFTVHCACGKERSIDTRNLPAWRIRCTTCRQVLFDPTTTLLISEEAPAQRRSERDLEQERAEQFQRWLKSSAELTELGGGSKERCALHPVQQAVAGCKKCGKTLCRACLDQVGNAFACARCSEALAPIGVLPVPTQSSSSERPPTAAEVFRAFERALLMAAQDGQLERPGSTFGKLLRLIYDHQRRLFKAPLEPRIQAGDVIRLGDGRRISVRAVRECVIDRVPCYLEVAWLPLG